VVDDAATGKILGLLEGVHGLEYLLVEEGARRRAGVAQGG
jgi:hypothetical protein